MRIRATSVSGSEPTNSALQGASVGQVHRDLVRILDHVVVGQHQPRWASMITPEPSDWAMRSCGMPEHAAEHRVVAERGVHPHPLLAVTLTTAGITFLQHRRQRGHRHAADRGRQRGGGGDGGRARRRLRAGGRVQHQVQAGGGETAERGGSGQGQQGAAGGARGVLHCGTTPG
jgi:hypothetical protein